MDPGIYPGWIRSGRGRDHRGRGNARRGYSHGSRGGHIPRWNATGARPGAIATGIYPSAVPPGKTPCVRPMERIWDATRVVGAMDKARVVTQGQIC